MIKAQKIFTQGLISLVVLLILIIPIVSMGKGLVPDCDNQTPATMCDFNKFMELINKVISFILFYLAVPVAAVMFAYAGFLLVTAGESVAEARTKAREIFLNTLYGLVLAAGAWLIVRTLLHILGYNGAWIGLPRIV